MAFALLAFGLPIVALIWLGWLIVRHTTGKRGKQTFSEITVNEYTALFYGTKRRELDHRDSWSMMREDDEAAAPPGGPAVDLDSGTMTIRPDAT
ncbi:MAG TPA: DUF6191 domain-containing protein [Pseudonocardiaceae bacterium]|jgi:hypothetical protein|nr:DUF6191 domain-containing protein [Pseudonocardiaceae bacterium]